MANSRVLVGVSFLGTTLAAVIALFWFWNKRDPDLNGVKKKRRNSLPVLVKVDGSPENVAPANQSPHPSDAAGQNHCHTEQESETLPESQNGLAQDGRPITPVHVQGALVGNVASAYSLTQGEACFSGEERHGLLEREIPDRSSLTESQTEAENDPNETGDVGSIGPAEHEDRTEMNRHTPGKSDGEVPDVGISRNRDMCNVEQQTCSHVRYESPKCGRSESPIDLNAPDIVPADCQEVSLQSALPSSTSEASSGDVVTETHTAVSHVPLTELIYSDVVISEENESETPRTSGESDKETPVACEDNETRRTEKEQVNTSDSEECCAESSAVTVSEVLVPEITAVTETQSSQAELQCSISKDDFAIKSSPRDVNCNENVTRPPPVEASQVGKSGSAAIQPEALQASVSSADSLETSPDRQLESGSDVSESNSLESAASETTTCTQESVHKGDNSQLPAAGEDESAECTRPGDDSDLAAGLDNGAVGSPAADDCDKNSEREPSQSTESGLSRDSLEPLDSNGQISVNRDGAEQTPDDDSGLLLTPTDPHTKAVGTPEKSEAPVNNSDNTSEASNDSGKGASVGETIGLPQQPELSLYQFDFPTELCGRLIGRHGKNINYMKEKTGTIVTLRNNPFSQDFQICSIEGMPHEIDETLAMIRQKFPKSRYPNLQLTPNNMGPEPPVVLPDLQMNLPHGVSVDVIVSSIVNAGLVFLQQPTHPTFPSLERLNQFMLSCYTQDQSVPRLPTPVESGVICAAPVMNGWYRALVVDLAEDGEECDVKFVDYGGYSRLPISHLRQIRSDFMTLPFQAVECYMANVTPIQGEMYFNSDGASVLEELTQGKLLQAQVVGRAEDGIPFVHIYQVSGNKALFVNREMVNRGVARWIEQL